MNKWVTIGIVIVIILIGAGLFFMMGRGGSPLGTSPTTDQAEQSSQMMSLKDLMAASTTQMCTFEDSASQTSGTVYVGNGKVRANVSSAQNGATATSYMISDGDFVYVWMEGQNQGYKTSIQGVDTMQQETTAETNQSVDVNKQMNYNCEGWTVDESQFALPTGIEFMELGEMMMPQGTTMPTGGATTGNSAQCAACNNLPADAQAQCKAALNC